MNDELFNLIKNENDHLRDLVLDYKVMLPDLKGRNKNEKNNKKTTSV